MADFTIKHIPGYGDVAVPQTSAQLGKFLALQRALNKFFAGQASIAEDGRPGPKTLALYDQIAGKVSGLTEVSSVNALASNAERFARVFADTLGTGYDASIPARMTVANVSRGLPGVPTSAGRVVWWVVGLLSVAGIATIGVLTYRRVKQQSSGVTNPRRTFRRPRLRQPTT